MNFAGSSAPAISRTTTGTRSTMTTPLVLWHEMSRCGCRSASTRCAFFVWSSNRTWRGALSGLM
eukprot:890331-Pyramimonas_sp.AAC.1